MATRPTGTFDGRPIGADTPPQIGLGRLEFVPDFQGPAAQRSGTRYGVLRTVLCTFAAFSSFCSFPPFSVHPTLVPAFMPSCHARTLGTEKFCLHCCFAHSRVMLMKHPPPPPLLLRTDTATAPSSSQVPRERRKQTTGILCRRPPFLLPDSDSFASIVGSPFSWLLSDAACKLFHAFRLPLGASQLDHLLYLLATTWMRCPSASSGKNPPLPFLPPSPPFILAVNHATGAGHRPRL